MREEINCKRGWKNEREEGRDGVATGALFSVLSHCEEPPQEPGSAELHQDLFPDFMLWCSLLLVTQTVSAFHKNTHPVLFLMTMPSTKQPGTR